MSEERKKRADLSRRRFFAAVAGSGHGFKHGPAVGKLAADNVLEKKPVEPLFSFARLEKARQSSQSRCTS